MLKDLSAVLNLPIQTLVQEALYPINFTSTFDCQFYFHIQSCLASQKQNCSG